MLPYYNASCKVNLNCLRPFFWTCLIITSLSLYVNNIFNLLDKLFLDIVFHELVLDHKSQIQTRIVRADKAHRAITPRAPLNKLVIPSAVILVLWIKCNQRPGIILQLAHKYFSSACSARLVSCTVSRTAHTIIVITVRASFC